MKRRTASSAALLVAMAAGVTWSIAGPCSAAPPSEHPGAGQRISSVGGAEAEPGVPRVHGLVSDRSLVVLAVGYPLSLARLRDRPECSALFLELGTSGEDMVSRTVFTSPSDQERRRFCVGRTAAITQVGSRVTKLCPRFGELDRHAAAMLVIHEALHQAGLHEDRTGRDAASPAAINSLVRRACGL